MINHSLLKYFTQAGLDISMQCNYHCDFCPTWQENRHGTEMFSCDDFRKLLTFIHPITYGLYLSRAGEPLTHNRFTEILELLTTHYSNREISMVTNGSLLNIEKIDAILNSNITRLVVSLDSLNRETYARLRKGGKLELVLKNISKFVTRRGKRKFPKLIINTVLVDSNVNELADFSEFCIRQNVDGFHLQNLIHFESVDTFSKSVEATSELRKGFGKIRKRLGANGIVFEQPFRISKDNFFPALRSMELYKYKVRYLIFSFNKLRTQLFSRCRRIGNDIRILQDGSVFSCSEKADLITNFISQRPKDIRSLIQDSKRNLHQHPFRTCETCRFLK